MTILQIIVMFVMIVAILGSVFEFMEYYAKTVRYGDSVCTTLGWWFWHVITAVMIVIFIISLTGVK